MINLHRVEFKDIWKIKVNGTTHGVLGVALPYLHLGITDSIMSQWCSIGIRSDKC